MNLRHHIRDLQLVENDAAEKAGMRFLLSFDESLLLGSKGKEFTDDYVEQLIEDILPEVKRAGEIGKGLREEVLE